MKTDSKQTAGTETVLVVGAGVIGIACAHYLEEAGYAVTVVDQSSVADACSRGNLGLICPSHILPLTEPGAIGKAIKSFFDPQAPFRVRPRLSPAFWNWMWQFARRCNRRQMLNAAVHLKAILDSSIDEYRQIVSEHGNEFEWRDSGLLYVLETDSGMREFTKTDRLLTDEFGASARRIESEELPGFDPAFKAGLAGAFYYEGDAFARPELVNSSWSRRLLQRGVNFVENCKLHTVETGHGRITGVQTSRGRMNADHFVFATGAWSASLSSQLDCPIPIEPGKGYSLTAERPGICPRYPMLFPEHGVGVTPFDNGYRLGSMMEFTGFDTSIPGSRMRQLQESASPFLVEPIAGEIQETWYGWRPMTWDSLPIIGRTPRLHNAYLATGHNMLGLSLAAATGRLIAEIVQEQPTHIDAGAFSPARF